MKTELDFKRKRFLENANIWLKILVFLKISDVKIVEKQILTKKDYSAKIRMLNKYNPLSYVIFIGFFFILVFINIKNEILPALIKEFRFR